MPHSRLIFTWLVSVLVFASSSAWACPVGKTWTDYSEIFLSFGNGSSLSFERFVDGLYVKLGENKLIKEMYSLPNGIYLFNGYDPTSSKRNPFMMLDMPVSIVLFELAGHFQYPCLVPAIPTSFSYTNSVIDRFPTIVSGNAHWADPSTVVFDLTTVGGKNKEDMQKVSGTIKFRELSPIPLDTNISKWIVTRMGGSPPEIIERQQDLLRFKDLGILIKGNEH